MEKEEIEPQQEVVDDEEIEESEELEEPKESKKSTLTFFMIFFPSVILSIIPSTINGGSIIPLGIKACILLLQLVILKNFVDTYYE